MRTRLLWFTIGLTSVSATMTHFIFKDLWADRLSLSSQVISVTKKILLLLFVFLGKRNVDLFLFLFGVQLKEKFSVLETRVSSLEVLRDSPNPQQVFSG